MDFYKRYTDKALAGMAELTLEERGAYNSILDLLYNRDGLVPDDDVTVARMIAVHWRTWAAMKCRLVELGKIRVEAGRIVNDKVMEVLIEASRLSQTQRKNASKRWQGREKPNEINEASMPSGNPIKIKYTEEEKKSQRETRARDLVAEKSHNPAKAPLISTEAFFLAGQYQSLIGVDVDDIGWAGLPYACQTWLTQGHKTERILSLGAALAGKPKRMSYHVTAVTSELSKPVRNPGGSNGQATSHRPSPVSGQPWQQRRDAQLDGKERALTKLRAAIDAPAEGGGEGGGAVIDLDATARWG